MVRLRLWGCIFKRFTVHFQSRRRIVKVMHQGCQEVLVPGMSVCRWTNWITKLLSFPTEPRLHILVWFHVKLSRKKFYLMSSGLPYQYMTENLTRHSLSVFFRCPASHQHSWRCWWLPACRWLLEVHQVAEGLHSKNEQHFGHDYRYPWVETSGIYPACFLFFCSSFCASASGSSSSSRKSMVFSWTEKVVGFQNHSKQLWLVFGDSKSFDSPCWSSLRSLLPSAGRGHSAGLCFCLCLWLSSGQPWWYCWGSIWPHKNSIGGGGRGPPWVIWERPMISVG